MAVGDLDAITRRDMWLLFSAYYEDVTHQAFRRDLAEKQHVILLRDSSDGTLQGMSTLSVTDAVVHGRAVVSIFSGDTVIAQAYWGQNALHLAFLRYLLRVKARRPLTPVYWHLISKGYKTYLLLTRNFPEHWPRVGRKTPPFAQALIDFLSSERFGDDYNPSSGLLEYEDKGRLKEGVVPVDTSTELAPDVRYFLARNPRHADGHELCCVGRVDLGFVLVGAFRSLTKRWLRR